MSRVVQHWAVSLSSTVWYRAPIVWEYTVLDYNRHKLVKKNPGTIEAEIRREETDDGDEAEEVGSREPGDDLQEDIAAEGVERHWDLVGEGLG